MIQWILLFITLVSAQQTSSPGEMASIIIFGILALVIGLLFTFFGRYLFRTVIFIAGFYFFALLTFTILVNAEPMSADGKSQWGSNRTAIYFGTCFSIGLVGGLLLSWLWRVGLFILGCLGGFFLAMTIAMAPFDTIGRNVFIAILTIFGGFLALFLEHHVIIVSTAIAGAFSFAFGVDCFANTGFRQSTYAILNGKPMLVLNNQTYALIGCMVGIAVLGIIVQYLITAKNVSALGDKPKKRQTNNSRA